ncbi:vacuolar protein sorting-associated protein 62 [Colletotrichum higginsianum]|nr:vacuolar protein sorting-associated protein 62 [Colletotrichum higginsianum]
MPSDLLTHIQHTSPALDGRQIPDLPALDLDNLEILNSFGDEVALTSNDDPTTYPPWLLGASPDADGRIHNATPCVVILVEKSESDLDAFYFYFYSYNEGPNVTQVLEPFDRLVNGGKAASGMHFGDHIGDWEHNMIRFRDGKPTGMYFSQHVDGESYGWDDAKLSKVDGRAGPPDESYPTPPPPSNLTSFFYYSGRWGDTSYPDSDPRQETVPRFKLRRFQTGPTGPRHKHLVRKGLKPDQRRKMGWMEWGVGVYMSLYPCCLRGWRAWVSMGLVGALVSAAVVGVVVGIRRHRTNKYRRLQAEDIPLDDWALEDDALLSSSEDEGSQKGQKWS